MPNYTTQFLAIPCSAINVAGLGACRTASAIPTQILSSLAGHYTISADTVRLIGDLQPLPLRWAA